MFFFLYSSVLLAIYMYFFELSVEKFLLHHASIYILRKLSLKKWRRVLKTEWIYNKAILFYPFLILHIFSFIFPNCLVRFYCNSNFIGIYMKTFYSFTTYLRCFFFAAESLIHLKLYKIRIHDTHAKYHTRR